MRSLFLTLLFSFAALFVSAQSPARYGYLSRQALIDEQPEMAAARTQIDSLRSQYQREAEYNERSFRRQFSEYLENQKQLNSTLLRKRQSELEAAMERALAFRRQAEAELKAAERKLTDVVADRVDAAIRVVGAERGYDCIINTDLSTHPYLNPALSEDASSFVREKLSK